MEANDTMLDDFPDALLCHILTFLPSKNAAATSVLAKRWRYLWTSTAVVLDFVDESEPNSDYSESGVFRRRRSRRVPPSLLASKTVVDLTLRQCLINVPSFQASSLWSLKRLVLERVDFRNDSDNFFLLLSGCPKIEELRVSGVVDHHDLWAILSNTLQSLYLELDLEFVDTHKGYDGFQLMINAPALRDLVLHMRRDLLKPFKFVLLYPCYWHIYAPSLVEAHISFDFLASFDHIGYVIMQSSLFCFLQKLSSIKELRIWCDRVPVDNGSDNPVSPGPVTRFLNLEELEFYGDLGFLFSLLEHADNLELLTLRRLWVMSINGWSRPLQVPQCIATHLEYVDLEIFMCSEAELELLNYLLVNAKVLKVVNVCCYPSLSWGDEVPYEVLEGMSSKIQFHVHRREWSHKCKACHVLFPGQCDCSPEMAELLLGSNVL